MPPNRRRDDDDYEDDDYDDRPRPKKKAKKAKSSNLPLIMGLVALGGVLVAVGLVAAGWYFTKDKEVALAPAPNQPQLTGQHKLQQAGGPVNPGPTAGQPGLTTPNPGLKSGAPAPKSSPAPAKPTGKVGLEVWDTAQEIDGEDIDGKKFKLSDYRGKVVVLDFWGDW